MSNNQHQNNQALRQKLHTLKLHPQWVLFLGNIHLLEDPTRVSLALNRVLRQVLIDVLRDSDVNESLKDDVELLILLAEAFNDLSTHALKNLHFETSTVTYKCR